MFQKDFAYFLTVTNIEHNDALQLIQQLQHQDNFRGALTPDYHDDDIKDKRIFFECGNLGSISEVNRDEVEQTMHNLATAFPQARFHLQAENVDNNAEQYQICTYGDMFQSSTLRTFMPALSQPVLFDQRNSGSPGFSNQDFLTDFLTGTDFNLLYQQKIALLQAREGNSSVPTETIDGLVNFLDFIGDWAEKEGVFSYPDLEQEETLTDSKKPSLDNIIASASDRNGTTPSAGKNPSKNFDR